MGSRDGDSRKGPGPVEVGALLAVAEGGVPSGEIGSDSVEKLNRGMGRLGLEGLV